MPDRYGFNHLGDDVRCIDCPTGGPIGRWPERKRAAHARSHDRAPDFRRQRNLLAAPPTRPNEEKEATAMATPSKPAPAKQVTIDILRDAGKPLHAKEIAQRVIGSGRCAGLKGKTPEATISAMLAVGSKPGGPFKRVDKGTYTLADPTGGSERAAPEGATAGQPEAAPAGKPAPSKPTQTAKPAGATKSTQSRKPAQAPKPKPKPKRTTTKRQPAKRTRR